MKKFYHLIPLCLLLLFGGAAQAQTTVTGTVVDNDTQEPLPGVNVAVKGQTEGDFASSDGKFAVTVSKYPITLVFSFIGFATQEVEVTAAQDLFITLMPASTLMNEVVVAASRTKQRKIESPVTIERIGTKDIINSPQVNYYDMVQGIKGVDVTVSSIGFTSVTTRGFNTSGNTNFLQLVDGMDNQAPGLNFPLGNVIGLTQLDVDNVEILSGASSALYGSRGLNGAMVMTGKDPFQYQGLSVLLNQGVNHVKSKTSNDPVGASPYTDITLRYAKRVGEKLAFKVNFQYTKANDWVASDTTNKNGPGTRYTDPNYNGVNLYGGATSVDITPFLQYAVSQDPSLAPIIDPLLTKQNYVARTGYPEYGYLNNNVRLMKSNAELRYKLTPGVQAIFSGTYGTGSVVYTNDTRYQIRDFKVGQYRAELLSKNWFLRAYTTQENSGKTLLAGPTAQYVNEAWKPSYDPNTGDGWYPQYTGALIQALAMGADLNSAHLAARSYADIGRPALGSAQFNHLKDSVSQRPITEGGTLFLDRSKLYNVAFQYNFSDVVKWAEIIAGVNYRMYDLNSKGTLFPDETKPIHVNEYSAYAQVIKRLIHDRLALTGSVRWDKNSLFANAKPTTRVSSVFELFDQNYLRFSFQNAYSFPSNIQSLQNTLNGYRSYSSGGSSYLLNDTYHFNVYAPYTLESVEKYQQTNDTNDLKKFVVNDIKPQTANSFELGYAAVLGKKVLVDVLGYFATWKDFIGYTNVANTPGTTDPTAFLDRNTYTVYNIAYNGAQTVNTYGYAASVSVDLSKNFIAKVNYYSDHLKNKNESQINNFNTPHYHINMEFGNTGFGKKKTWSFNTTLRYKPGYFYQVAGGLGNGTVPSSTVIDAQVGYKILSARSTVKLGATNLTNRYYSTGIANPTIGGMYYVSLAYNVF
ncbi:TonB-dependent Receptor Plug Domain [Chryseolinea serpens]|uniref:TonB-dependent Receptor Plug Domain n=1 Tax=Chryseolinea serpens TaxID=947013 RepID=A0A1M5QVS9_9BACT|nr:carboxypeptidase-like regulatory domain-containing protein [Chryseolinea serpens]SHH18021.1 TonB-dependent Receptor Plug Domain [Chryseolinea serpens]